MHNIPSPEKVFATLLPPSVPIVPAEVDKFVSGFGEGAVVTFAGVVRPTEKGEPITGLEYEWHTTLAERELRKVVADIAQRFEVLRVACVHRTGFVPVGDLAVYVAVSSRHRAAAFEACAGVIEELKRRVPVWKTAKVCKDFDTPVQKGVHHEND